VGDVQRYEFDYSLFQHIEFIIVPYELSGHDTRIYSQAALDSEKLLFYFNEDKPKLPFTIKKDFGDLSVRSDILAEIVSRQLEPFGFTRDDENAVYTVILRESTEITFQGEFVDVGVAIIDIKLMDSDGGVLYNSGNSLKIEGFMAEDREQAYSALFRKTEKLINEKWLDKSFILTAVYDDMIAKNNALIVNDPNNAFAYSDLGGLYILKGDSGRGLERCSKAIKIDPSCAEAYNNRACGYLMRGEFDKAVADASIAISIKPDYVDAYDTRGRAYRGKGDDRAEADFLMFKNFKNTGGH
jgi:tetratricopeptide (TPR) repeat protein